MKTTIFLIIASLAVISAKPSDVSVSASASASDSSSYDENTINCYIVHLKKAGLFTGKYNPVPSTNILVDCEALLETHRQTVLKTYLTIFTKNANTAPFAQCIVDNFKQTAGNDEVLLNFVYEDARLKGALDKDTFCELSIAAKAKIEGHLSESYKACNPGSQFGNIFTFHSQCEDPKQ
jgi:hypothetical protein